MIPNKIYLQVGEKCPEDAIEKWEVDPAHVTWNAERIYDNDVEYVRPPTAAAVNAAVWDCFLEAQYFHENLHDEHLSELITRKIMRLFA